MTRLPRRPLSDRSDIEYRKVDGGMASSIEIEQQGRHQYVVRLQDGEDVGESWFNLTPEVLEQLRVDEDAEGRCVRRTTEFLLEHQSVADFPDIVELEDVIATYEDYSSLIRAQASP
jgi:hypothetical protein